MPLTSVLNATPGTVTSDGRPVTNRKPMGDVTWLQHDNR